MFRIGYPKNMPKNFNINKVKYLRMITKSFQRRFRQEVIDGLVDQECLIISQNLVKKLY